MARQGRFKPKNIKKYRGNVDDIIYRSSWELFFLKYCDSNPNIIKYSSEEVIIPYYLRGKKHRYFVDFWVRYIHEDKEEKEMLIEVKPYAQRFPPQDKRRRTKRWMTEAKTYEKNIAKWTTAIRYANQRGMEFRVFDEYDLGIKKRPKGGLKKPKI